MQSSCVNGGCSIRIVRGGDWSRREPKCRVSDRDGFTPTSRSYNFGFRVACKGD
ncbi:MAG: formylglycine-generating enzyme family protein [Dysgonamonadaceae bacterium]|nr:formylglycine-generating enzyme family protein [Dysgonamonadaceae bacterium]